MFERAAADRWDPRSSLFTSSEEDCHPEDKLEQLESMFLENLYALIASEELPDNLVDSILKLTPMVYLRPTFAFPLFIFIPFFLLSLLFVSFWKWDNSADRRFFL